jgi:putative Mn2+ efflux pump MntP
MTLLLILTGMAIGVFLYHYAGRDWTIFVAAILLVVVFVREAMLHLARQRSGGGER